MLIVRDIHFNYVNYVHLHNSPVASSHSFSIGLDDGNRLSPLNEMEFIFVI